MKLLKKLIPLTIYCFTAFLQPPHLAAESEPLPWQFGISIYGWFPDISGQTAFSPSNGNGDFEIDIDNVLDNLEFTLMGCFDMRKGRVGILTDLIYMDVGASGANTSHGSIGGNQIPVDATANVNFDMKSWIWTLTGYYRGINQSSLTLDYIAGMRYLDVEQTVDWNITGNVGSIQPSDRTGAANTSLSNWDAIIGVRSKFSFGTRDAWFIPVYFDLGFGESDFTWQGIAGLGYSFGWGEVTAIWRYLYYDLPSGKAIKDMNFSGPAIGMTFRW